MGHNNDLIEICTYTNIGGSSSSLTHNIITNKIIVYKEITDTRN